MKSRLRANITCHKALFFGGASEISKFGGGGACCRDICMNVVQGHREAGSWCSRI